MTTSLFMKRLRWKAIRVKGVDGAGDRTYELDECGCLKEPMERARRRVRGSDGRMVARGGVRTARLVERSSQGTVSEGETDKGVGLNLSPEISLGFGELQPGLLPPDNECQEPPSFLWGFGDGEDFEFWFW